MRTLTGAAIIITLMILAYTLKQPALAYIFHHNEVVPTPNGWTPKMRNWINGQLQ